MPSRNKYIQSESLLKPTETVCVHNFIIENDVKKKNTKFFYLAVLSGALLILAGGSNRAWASSAIIKLKSNNSEENPIGRPITTVEISFLIGTPTLALLVGSLFLPKLADLLGRKMILQITGMGMMISTIGIAFSRNIYVLIAFNSAFGATYAGIWILPTYLAEICEDHNRAKFGSLVYVCIPLGQLLSYICGSLLDLKLFTLMNEAPIILSLLLLLLAPESPVYLLTKGKKEDCKKVLEKLRSNKTKSELNDDYDKLKTTFEETVRRKTNVVRCLKVKEVRVGLLLALMPILIQYFSGVPVLMLLVAPIFSQASTLVSGNVIAVIGGLVKVVSFTFTSFIIEKTGRRPMLLLSSIGSGISASILGLYFFLHSNNSPLVKQFQWLPLVSVSLYISLYSLGLGPIPQCLPSELFLSDLRSTVCSIIGVYNGLLLAFFSFGYPLLAETIGDYSCLWIFSAFCFIGALLFYFLVPETQGKSVLEIQNILKEY